MPDGSVHVYPQDGPLLRGGPEVLDLIGEACWNARASWVAVPAERLHDDFFVLSTGVAGEIAQKFVNYGVGLAVVGDISRHVAASSALTAWVTESNRGRHLWFVRDLDDLAARRAALG
ncbi:DUF4180 domain-containing protein [Nonomuraea sp. NPDC046802]|uniref:DUF4180 domain-containing protein n=1 Tax=Nonomuraea sp. NPDC046802 TaxID=3154919 RepID=UPI0033CEFE44